MKIVYKSLYIITILLIVCFAIFISIDYFNYNPTITSAPFYINIIIRLIEFILPGIITFIIGYIIKNKI